MNKNNKYIKSINEFIDKFSTSSEEKEKIKTVLDKFITDYNKKSKIFLYNFSWFWSISSVLYFAATTFVEITNPRVADTVLGFMIGTAVAVVLNYHFGSSLGSSDKTSVIENVLNNK